MSTAVRPHPESAAPRPGNSGGAADVFVVFGITGDLAKVMTFRSLYRLERRGLLSCPIVGVAVDDWTTTTCASAPARRSSTAARPLDAGGLRPLRRAALLRRRATSATPPPTSAWRGALERRAAPGLLPRDPAVPVRHGGQGAGGGRPARERARRGREAVRPRPRVGARARRRAAQLPRRVAALPDRPLPREDGPRARSSTCGSRTRCSSRSGTATTSSSVQITMAEDFGVEDRGHFYDPVGALRDVVVNHLMQVVGAAAMEPPAGRDLPTLEGRAWRRSSGRCRTADPAHYVRGQYDGYRDIDGVAADSTTETYAALRLEIDNWRWSGVPFFIRTGKLLPVTQTELRLVFQRPPRLGFAERCGPSAGAGPARDQARPARPASGCSSRPSARTRPSRSRSTSTWSSRTRAARAPRPTRCCCTRR